MSTGGIEAVGSISVGDQSNQERQPSRPGTMDGTKHPSRPPSATTKSFEKKSIKSGTNSKDIRNTHSTARPSSAMPSRRRPEEGAELGIKRNTSAPEDLPSLLHRHGKEESSQPTSRLPSASSRRTSAKPSPRVESHLSIEMAPGKQQAEGLDLDLEEKLRMERELEEERQRKQEEEEEEELESMFDAIQVRPAAPALPAQEGREGSKGGEDHLGEEAAGQELGSGEVEREEGMSVVNRGSADGSVGDSQSGEKEEDDEEDEEEDEEEEEEEGGKEDERRQHGGKEEGVADERGQASPKYVRREMIDPYAASQLPTEMELADSLIDAGDMAGARDAMKRVALLAHDAGDKRTEEKALLRVACLYQDSGNMKLALEWHHKHLEFTLEHELFEAQIAALDNISYAYLMQGLTHNSNLFSERANEARKMQKLRIQKEMGVRGNSAILRKAEQMLQDSMQQAEQEKVKKEADMKEQAELERHEKLQGKQDSIETLIRILKKDSSSRTEQEITKLCKVVDGLDYMCSRATEVQRREICRKALYEQHQESFPMFEHGDLADRVWIILGCTPVLEDYHGSVDIEGEYDEYDELLPMRTIEAVGLIGHEVLDGETERMYSCVVSDDGQDDIITQNHFMVITVDDFNDSISTFYHRIFTCRPSDATLDASWAELGDQGASDLSWHLVNSGNTSLTQISLAANNIGPEASESLSQLIEECWSIESIDLSDNHLGDEGVATLCQALRHNRTLTCLNLSANMITSKGAWVIRDLFHGSQGEHGKMRNITLTALNMERNEASFSDIMPQRIRPPLLFPVRESEWEEEVYNSRPGAGATGLQVEKADPVYCTAGWGREKLAAGAWRVEHSAKSGAPLEHLASRIRAMLKESKEYRVQALTPRVADFSWKGSGKFASGGPLKRSFYTLDTRNEMIVPRPAIVTAFKKFDIALARTDVEAFLETYGMSMADDLPSANTGQARRGIMVAYPYLVEVLEGGCQDMIREFRIRRESEEQEEAKRKVKEALGRPEESKGYN